MVAACAEFRFLRRQCWSRKSHSGPIARTRPVSRGLGPLRGLGSALNGPLWLLRDQHWLAVSRILGCGVASNRVFRVLGCGSALNCVSRILGCGSALNCVPHILGCGNTSNCVSHPPRKRRRTRTEVEPPSACHYREFLRRAGLWRRAVERGFSLAQRGRAPCSRGESAR